MNDHNMHTISFDIKIQADKEKIFQAVSLPEHLVNWWPLHCTGEPYLGAEYNFNFTDQYDWYAIVDEFNPAEKIGFKMTKSDPDWDPTRFTFALEADRDGTWLCFDHMAWPDRNRHFRYSSYCWAMLLQSLKEYLEDGKIIPFEKRS